VRFCDIFDLNIVQIFLIFRVIRTFQTCSVFADNQKGATTYESTVGKDLPYVSSSLVDKQCQNCAWTVNNDDDETNENFIQIYKKAAKCESKMNTNQNSDADCNYIHGLSTLEKRIARKNSKGSFSATLWILFMMMSCFLLASYAYFLLDSKSLLYFFVFDQNVLFSKALFILNRNPKKTKENNQYELFLKHQLFL